MKSKKLINLKATIKVALACVVIGWMCWSVGNVCNAQTPPSNLSSGLQEVVKLSQSHMGDEVIVNYIKNSGKSYRLSADDIIYLNGQGVSQSVISTLQTASSANPTPPPVVSSPTTPTAEPPPVVSNDSPVAANPNSSPDNAEDNNLQPKADFDSFHEQLSPYGNWIQTPDGPVWQPNVTVGWRPYYDGGHWVNTDAGWYWQSDYTWGDIAFHYGRWSYNASYGWTWTPAYDFAPAWVCWRHADDDGFCGWAPLPPGAVFVDGGWMFHGARVGVDFDFGLTVGLFTFVGYDHFWEHDFRRFIVPHDRLAFIYRRSVFENHYRLDHGRFVNEGLDRDRMAHFTGREVRVENVHAIRTQEVHDHILQRQNDREIVKAGGRIDATKRMESGHNTEPNSNGRKSVGTGSGNGNSGNTDRQNKPVNPSGNPPKYSQGNSSGNTLNNTTGHPENPNVNGPSVSGKQTGSQTIQSPQTSTNTPTNKKSKKKTN